MPHRTPCTESADDRARIFVTRRTPCIESADDRARILNHHRTPCTESADDRARILNPHRTPCTESADDRADKLCTPCTSSASSPRARMAPLWEGLSSASCPSCSTLLSASRRHWHRRYPELQSSRVAATPSSPSFLRAPHKVPSIGKRAQNFFDRQRQILVRFVDVTHRSQRRAVLRLERVALEALESVACTQSAGGPTVWNRSRGARGSERAASRRRR
jgi:hypothetical protein